MITSFHFAYLLSRFISSGLCDPVDRSPPGSSVHGDSSVKNTGVGRHILLQEIFLTQGSNPHFLSFLYWQVDFFTASTILEAIISGSLLLNSTLP